jgi:F-type H+-transporting ATPase subunit epsilon
MAETIQVDIVTPERAVYSGPAEMITAPGSEGEFGVLPGHAAFVATLKPGRVEIKKDNQELHFAASGGFAEVVDDKLIILSKAVEKADEINVSRAEAAMARAQERLDKPDDKEIDFVRAAAALERAKSRLIIAARK